MKKKTLEQLSKHHIIPSSRGGDTRPNNIAIITRDKHNKYHALFDNKTPDEIIDYLHTYFWAGRLDRNIYIP